MKIEDSGLHTKTSTVARPSRSGFVLGFTVLASLAAWMLTPQESNDRWQVTQIWQNVFYAALGTTVVSTFVVLCLLRFKFRVIFLIELIIVVSLVGLAFDQYRNAFLNSFMHAEPTEYIRE